MSVQINCCPVKGRDRFQHPHQRALLAGVQLPACTQGDRWPLLTLTLCPELAWLTAGCPGSGHWSWTDSCVPGLGLVPWYCWQICTVPGQSQVWGWGQAVLPFPCRSQLTVNEILRPLFLWPQLVLQFICSSVQSQEEALSGPELLSPGLRGDWAISTC